MSFLSFGFDSLNVLTYSDKHRRPNVSLQSVVVYAKFQC